MSFDDDGITVHDIGSVKDLRREKRTSIAGVILEWVKADVRGFVEGALTFGRRRKDSAEEAESAKATRKSLRESRRTCTSTWTTPRTGTAATSGTRTLPLFNR